MIELAKIYDKITIDEDCRIEKADQVSKLYE
jgi:hypothetical protein